MKKAVLTTLLTLISISSFGETLKLKCDPSQDAETVETTNSFSGQITMTNQEGGVTFADLIVSTRRQGRDSQYELLTVDELAGQRRIIPAGELVKTEATNFELSTHGQGEVEAVLNLTLGLPHVNAFLRTSDGVRYASLCLVESREE
jgi:hypothetical protein